MEQFIEALPAFGICLVLWLVGFVVLDIKTFTRFFKQEAYIMDKSAIVIAIACYMIMVVICGVLAYVHQN